MNQNQGNNLITDKNPPFPLVRNGFIFIILAILFVAAIYYGIINP
ncbi:hypothetical protein [Sphaerospermopsis aphanizomenoides]|nr:hypothetical protein [Sphaerospermopsis aphanizomenoides]